MKRKRKDHNMPELKMDKMQEVITLMSKGKQFISRDEIAR